MSYNFNERSNELNEEVYANNFNNVILCKLNIK